MPGIFMTVTKSYLLGVLHDATLHKNTYRIAQKNKAFMQFLVIGIKTLGYSAWMYKEGRNRSIYIAEFSASILKGHAIQTRKDKIEYIRSYFDAEGGIAKNKKSALLLILCAKELSRYCGAKNFFNAIRY